MLPKAIPERSVDAELESRTVKAVYSYFSTLNPDATLDPLNYMNDRSNSIGCLGVKPLSRKEFIGFLDSLLNGIVLPTHKFRVNIERVQRRITHIKLETYVANLIPMLEDEPIENFINYYAGLLQQNIDHSHEFQVQGILGSAGNLDTKPEFMLEREASERENKGNDLQEDRIENKNWVNSTMAYLHG